MGAFHPRNGAEGYFSKVKGDSPQRRIDIRPTKCYNFIRKDREAEETNIFYTDERKKLPFPGRIPCRMGVRPATNRIGFACKQEKRDTHVGENKEFSFQVVFDFRCDPDGGFDRDHGL